VEFPAPYAPQRRAPREEGFQFTVNGLTADTKYFYRLETKDDKDRVIYTDEGSFRTENVEVAAVKALIDAIGEVVYSEDCKIRIDDAQDAYNALSDEHKALITNYATLTDAGQQYEELKKAAEAALFQDKKDELKALLDALLLPDDSEACLNIVADAKAALEAIALDGGMTITGNIEALEAAGRAIREQAQADLEAQREAEGHTTPTGLEEGRQENLQQGADGRSTLVIRNGVLYILRAGRTYLLSGQLVQ
jgi:hypothetical protein